jgi:hypothetical protein
MPSMAAWLPRAALAALPLLAGCSETFWTANIRDSRHFPPNSVIMTNADIRTINRIEGFERTRQVVRDAKGEPVVREIANGKTIFERQIILTPRQFVCAEPSPDVARVVQAALSTAVSGSADIANPVAATLTGASTVQASAAGRLDASRSEAVAQLTRRIGTIQLLRDGMYRACEAYANGAIGQEIYTAIVSRYDKIMVTMLLGEMASGNLPGSATAGGDASAGAAPGDLAAVSAKAEEAKNAARTGLSGALDDRNTANLALIAKQAANTKVVANEKATDEEKRTAKSELSAAEATHATAEEKLKLAQRTSNEADQAATAAATAARLGAGRATTASQARVVGATSTTSQVADTLYRMQREYLNDSQLGTQVLICAAEAAQPDPMGGYQKEFCDKIFAAAFDARGGTPSTERARAIQMAELRKQAIAQVVANLPATTTGGQRVELIRMVRDMFQ